MEFKAYCDAQDITIPTLVEVRYYVHAGSTAQTFTQPSFVSEDPTNCPLTISIDTNLADGSAVSLSGINDIVVNTVDVALIGSTITHTVTATNTGYSV